MQTGFLPTASLQIRATARWIERVERVVVVELGALGAPEQPADLGLERALEAVAHLRVVGQAGRLDPGAADRAAALVDDHADRDLAAQRHADPVAHHAVHRADQHGAVEIDPAGLDLLDDRGASPVRSSIVPFGATAAAMPRSARERGVGGEVAVLAVHRHQHPRPQQLLQRHQVGAVGVARDVVEAVATRRRR